MSATDRLVQNNRAFASSFDKAGLEIVPNNPVAIVTCIDARLDPARILGLDIGDAHVIRNAGGLVTDDVLRSLAISQHLLGTSEIVLMHHTGCGMTLFKDDEVSARIEESTGSRPPMPLGAFPDPEDDLRSSLAAIRNCAYLKSRDARAFIYRIEDGRLTEIT